MLALAALAALAVEARALSGTLPGYDAGRQAGTEEESRPGGIVPVPSLSSPAEEREPLGDATRPDVTASETPEVIYDESRLPEPVQRMRRLIIEACKSGDIERLRPLIGAGDSRTQLLLGELDGDPVDFLRQISGDEEGHEIMAILLEVMQSGFVHLNPGAENEYYVWPYFFAIPIDDLTPPQRVELFTLLTASDYEEMKNFGAYIFYRSAITPEGRWLFFVAGD
ncbi:cytoplasmic protein [Chelativorans sp. AA-79]|uniref:cytoplasmic protein n=1 Tax=Chelativorans sp. AA-79 TaxID=3028735 RepID=UPI0023F7A59E|nr:cytoplasmic protein [Chelativorans sp. AA-79]WEX07661.1 cytoplasmic protein [Chelativorans sp. AA-79]